jgi:hypothetical protein
MKIVHLIGASSELLSRFVKVIIINIFIYLFIYLSGRSGDRIPVGARISESVQTGPGGLHSLLYYG